MVWLIGMVYHAGCATRLWAACGSGELACDSVFLFGSCLGISQDFKAVSKQQPSDSPRASSVRFQPCLRVLSNKTEARQGLVLAFSIRI